MDAKNYIRRRWAADLSNGLSNHSALENILNDTRLKIELLPPPDRYVVRQSAFTSEWCVDDEQKQIVAAMFRDQARAVDYAKWQNSLETE